MKEKGIPNEKAEEEEDDEDVHIILNKGFGTDGNDADCNTEKK